MKENPRISQLMRISFTTEMGKTTILFITFNSHITTEKTYSKTKFCNITKNWYFTSQLTYSINKFSKAVPVLLLIKNLYFTL